MSDSRDSMLAALKRVVVPDLRTRGFRGSIPHFRRERTKQIDLLAIQFSRWGGEFVVELARAPVEGLTLQSGKVIPPDKLRAYHVVSRLRLGAANTNSDHWFKFGGARAPDDFDRVARQVLPLLETQGEAYWRDA